MPPTGSNCLGVCFVLAEATVEVAPHTFFHVHKEHHDVDREGEAAAEAPGHLGAARCGLDQEVGLVGGLEGLEEAQFGLDAAVVEADELLLAFADILVAFPPCDGADLAVRAAPVTR